MKLLFWRQEKSLTRSLIETFRKIIAGNHLYLDEARKEEIAEVVRRVHQSEANAADLEAQRKPRKYRKLMKYIDEEESELINFLTELGVGRYSPQGQKNIDEATAMGYALLAKYKKES